MSENNIPLDSFELESGDVCYILRDQKDWNVLWEHDLDMGFVMSLTNFEYTQNNKKSTYSHPQVFKYSKTILGVSMIPVESKAVSSIVYHGSYNLSLPKIPFKMMRQMEVFFRSVEEKHGTESIVILIYNPSVGGQEGWGLLVPTQTNTSTHCDYDPPSIMKKKPKGSFIVGSVHSHPSMPAFASGTDHHDQKHFDGIHITFGWQPANNNEIEYYAELQTMGHTFELDISEVAEIAPPLVNEEYDVSEWVEQVSKRTVVSQTGYEFEYGYGAGSHGTTGVSRLPSSSGTRHSSSIVSPVVNLPENAPSFQEYQYIVPITKNAKTCPVCGTSLVPFEISDRMCAGCETMFAVDGESIDDMIKHIHTSNAIYPELLNGSTVKGYVFWDPAEGKWSEIGKSLETIK